MFPQFRVFWTQLLLSSPWRISLHLLPVFSALLLLSFSCGGVSERVSVLLSRLPLRASRPSDILSPRPLYRLSGLFAMSIYKSALNSSFVLKDAFALSKYRTKFSIDHPEYFPADGLVVFCGGQGAGKTLSAVRYLDRLVKDYPKVIVVSNIELHLQHEPAQLLPYESLEKVRTMDNGYAGIVLLLDEIQVEFNSLESMHIHPSVFQTISQQRKRRLHVIGTTQLFGRLAKPWREQCNVCVDCSPLLGGLVQRNSVIDFGSIAEDMNGNLTSYDYSYHTYWFRSPAQFDMYNTFERVNRIGKGK